LLQGTGGGVISSQVLGVIQDLFDARGRAKAMGAYGVVGGLAGLGGPLLGALLVTVLPLSLGWRAVVIVSAPLAALTLAFGARHLPRSAPARALRNDAVDGAPAPARAGIDLLGLALLAAATVSLVLPFVQPGLTRAASAGLVAGAVAVLALFTAWERHAGHADPGAVILPPVLARAPGFVTGTLVSTFWFGAQLAQQAVVTLYLLDTLRVPPLLVAVVALPSSAAGALTAAVSWRIVARYGTRVISVALALQVLLTATVALVLPGLTTDTAVPLLLVVNALSGVASGFIDSQNRAQTLQHSPDASRGVAAGFLQLAQRLSSTVCIAAATGIALTSAPAQPSPQGLELALGLCATLVTVSVLISLRRRTGD